MLTTLSTLWSRLFGDKEEVERLNMPVSVEGSDFVLPGDGLLNPSKKSEGAEAAREFLKLYKEDGYKLDEIKNYLEREDGKRMLRQLVNDYPDLTKESKVIRPSETCRHLDFGDIHGQEVGLKFVFYALQTLDDPKLQNPEAKIEKYLITCTGDILDRGEYSLECYVVLVSLRLLCFQQGKKGKIAFHLMRGNHELEWSTNERYGDKWINHYKSMFPDLEGLMTDLYAKFPYFLILQAKVKSDLINILICHGAPAKESLQNLLWNDVCNEPGCRFSKNPGTNEPSKRGNNFCKTHLGKLWTIGMFIIKGHKDIATPQLQGDGGYALDVHSTKGAVFTMVINGGVIDTDSQKVMYYLEKNDKKYHEDDMKLITETKVDDCIKDVKSGQYDSTPPKIITDKIKQHEGDIAKYMKAYPQAYSQKTLQISNPQPMPQAIRKNIYAGGSESSCSYV